MPAAFTAYKCDDAPCLEEFPGSHEGALGYAEVLPCLLILPGECWLLETAEEASQVNIEEHGCVTDLPGLAELEEVVLEELVAFHGWAS